MWRSTCNGSRRIAGRRCFSTRLSTNASLPTSERGDCSTPEAEAAHPSMVVRVELLAVITTKMERPTIGRNDCRSNPWPPPCRRRHHHRCRLPPLARPIGSHGPTCRRLQFLLLCVKLEEMENVESVSLPPGAHFVLDVSPCGLRSAVAGAACLCLPAPPDHPPGTSYAAAFLSSLLSQPNR